jgi:hypothetical protein
MLEDLGNHGGIYDGGDDRQGAAAVGALFNIDIEYPFEQPSSDGQAPQQGAPRRGRLRGMGVDRRVQNDLGTEPRVGCEHAMEADEMEPWTGNQGGESLQKLQGWHEDVGRALSIGGLQGKHDLPGTVESKALVGDGGRVI